LEGAGGGFGSKIPNSGFQTSEWYPPLEGAGGGSGSKIPNSGFQTSDSTFKNNSINPLITSHNCPIQGYTYVSGGIYCLKRSAIRVLENAIPKGISRMRNYQQLLVDKGLYLKAYPFSKIIDVDHAEDIAKAEDFLRSMIN
jgi:hypothetical protein